MANIGAVGYTTFLGKMGDTSLFNEASFNAISNKENGAYRVVIESEGSRSLTPEDEGVCIVGTILGGVNFNTSSNWDELGLDSALGGLISNIPWLNIAKEGANMVSKVGGVSLESGLQSKKFYTGGSFLNFPIRFKVLDDDNSGKAIATAMTLVLLTLPRNNWNRNIGDAVKTFVDDVLGVIDNTTKKRFTEEYQKAIDAAKEGLMPMIENGVKPLTVIKNAAHALGEEDVRLTESPTTVKITIGNWLVLENMVIDSVNVNFSEQMTELGPQSVEIEVMVSSRNKLIMDEAGIINGHGRIKVIRSKNTKTTKTAGK